MDFFIPRTHVHVLLVDSSLLANCWQRHMSELFFSLAELFNTTTATLSRGEGFTVGSRLETSRPLPLSLLLSPVVCIVEKYCHIEDICGRDSLLLLNVQEASSLICCSVVYSALRRLYTEDVVKELADPLEVEKQLQAEWNQLVEDRRLLRKIFRRVCHSLNLVLALLDIFKMSPRLQEDIY